MASISQIPILQKGSIVKALASKSYSDVGYEFNLDRLWSKPNTMRTNINKIYNEVRNSANPLDYGLTPDILEMVAKALEERKINSASYNAKQLEAKKETQEMLAEQDIKSLAVSGRDKSAILIHKKMDMISKKPSLLEKESLVNLAKVFATFFDKAQIIQGQATEHIAVLAKMDDNISPEDAMNMLLKIRENNLADKDRRKV